MDLPWRRDRPAHTDSRSWDDRRPAPLTHEGAQNFQRAHAARGRGQAGLREPEKKKFALLPEDTYEVVIDKLEDKENRSFENPEETETVIAFTFLITEDGP